MAWISSSKVGRSRCGRRKCRLKRRDPCLSPGSHRSRRRAASWQVAGLDPGAGKARCHVATPLPGAGEAGRHLATDSSGAGEVACPVPTVVAGSGNVHGSAASPVSGSTPELARAEDLRLIASPAAISRNAAAIKAIARSDFSMRVAAETNRGEKAPRSRTAPRRNRFPSSRKSNPAASMATKWLPLGSMSKT